MDGDTTPLSFKRVHGVFVPTLLTLRVTVYSCVSEDSKTLVTDERILQVDLFTVTDFVRDQGVSTLGQVYRRHQTTRQQNPNLRRI